MSCNNLQILNYNHNVVEVGPDNKIVITDKVKCNSITIPQPVTKILQINSPGPQGPSGTGGGGGSSIDTGSFVTTSSFNAFTSSYNTGSFTGSFTGSLFGTATTASYITSSFFTGTNAALSASYATTASYAANIPSLKASSASIVSFSGTPKSSSITFASSFPNNSYAVTVTGEDARSWTIQSKTSAGFTINSNSTVALTGPVYWIATPFN